MPYIPLKNYQESTPLNLYQNNSFNYNNPEKSSYYIQKQRISDNEKKVDYSTM